MYRFPQKDNTSKIILTISVLALIVGAYLYFSKPVFSLRGEIWICNPEESRVYEYIADRGDALPAFLSSSGKRISCNFNSFGPDEKCQSFVNSLSDCKQIWRSNPNFKHLPPINEVGAEEAVRLVTEAAKK